MQSSRFVLALFLAGLSPLTLRADDVEYRRDIKPVLKAKCYSCHGALKQEAGLRVDTVRQITRGGDSGAALDHDDGLQSLIWQRISATDPQERMPPEGEPLSPELLATFRQWLKNGAAAPDNEQPQPNPTTHWAFQPLKKSAAKSDAHPIDGFVDEKTQ